MTTSVYNRKLDKIKQSNWYFSLVHVCCCREKLRTQLDPGENGSTTTSKQEELLGNKTNVD